MEQPAGTLRRLVCGLSAIPLVLALAAGCTSQAQRGERGDVLVVGSPTPTPSSTVSALPVGRAPACSGQPTPTPSPQYMRSYVDFVQLAGRLYVLADVQPSGVAGGRRLGVVRCVFDDGRAPAPRATVDGDASRLLPGTLLLAHPPVEGRPALVADRPEGPLLYVLLEEEPLGPPPSRR